VRSPILRLSDIIEAVERIRSVLGDMPLDVFENEWQAQWLVERGIEIISEASRHLPDELKARRPHIPWEKVAGIGNILRHNYESIACKRSCATPLGRSWREPHLWRHATHIFSGVAGMSICAAPGTASAIAFMMAASAPVVPASPTPLTPSGFVVAGTLHSAAVSGGTSAARGMA
jgi:uncharacterized protein with HEPN domain